MNDPLLQSLFDLLPDRKEKAKRIRTKPRLKEIKEEIMKCPNCKMSPTFSRDDDVYTVQCLPCNVQQSTIGNAWEGIETWNTTVRSLEERR